MNKFRLSSLLLVVLIALTCLGGGCAARSQGGHFYFVQITDTHLGEDEQLEQMKTVAESINELPMDLQFIVHTGDITSDRIEDEQTMLTVKSLFEQLKAPVHVVSGNHDVLKSKLQETSQAYRKYFGDLYSKAEYHGVVFLFMYTEPLAREFTLDQRDPLEWLEASLKAAKGKPVVIFHHAPSAQVFYKGKFHDGWPTDVHAQWKSLINSYNVKAVIAGHLHKDEHHWLGDVPLYVCSPVASYGARQSTYRLYEYKDGKIGYWTQYMK